MFPSFRFGVVLCLFSVAGFYLQQPVNEFFKSVGDGSYSSRSWRGALKPSIHLPISEFKASFGPC